MQNPTHNTLTKSVALSCLAIAAFVAAAPTTQAQTYYYYPSQPASYPAAPPAYYTTPTYPSQNTWSGYTPQYYQAAPAAPSHQPVETQPYAPATYTQPTYSAPAIQPAATGPQYIQTSYVQPHEQPTATIAAAPNTAAAPAPAPAGDAYGFLGWLNSTRAAYGLSAVGYDPNLESWAAMNSAQQAGRGIGHFVMGPARRQNSAMGAFPGVESMWMASPAHRAALLDPTIQWIGIAAYGAYWTFNAY